MIIPFLMCYIVTYLIVRSNQKYNYRLAKFIDSLSMLIVFVSYMYVLIYKFDYSFILGLIVFLGLIMLDIKSKYYNLVFYNIWLFTCTVLRLILYVC